MSRFTVPIDTLERVGSVSRAENVLGFRSGAVITSSDQGHLTRIEPDGTQSTWGDIPGGQPTSMALLDDGSVLTNNTRDGKVYRIYADGHHEVAIETADGRPIGAVNYVLRDAKDRIWLAVRSRQPQPGGIPVDDDGYIALIDEPGAEPRTVAQGLAFPNEIKFSADGRSAYVPETVGRRVSVFDVAEDGGLSGRRTHGPEDLGSGGYPDGLTLDIEGNAWVAFPNRNGVAVIRADGEVETVFEAPLPEAIDAFDRAWKNGWLDFPTLMATAGPDLSMPTSIAFAGPDLRTAYIGSLRMPHLLRFRSPTAGVPLRHQADGAEEAA